MSKSALLTRARADAEAVGSNLNYSLPEDLRALAQVRGNAEYEAAFVDGVERLCQPGRVTAVWRKRWGTILATEHENGVAMIDGRRVLFDSIEELGDLLALDPRFRRFDGLPSLRAAVELANLLGHDCAPDSLCWDSSHELWVEMVERARARAPEDGPSGSAWTPIFGAQAPEPIGRAGVEPEKLDALHWARENLGHTGADDLARASRVQNMIWVTTTGRLRIFLSEDAIRCELRSPAHGWGEIPFLALEMSTRGEYGETVAPFLRVFVSRVTFILAAEKPERLDHLWTYLVPVFGALVGDGSALENTLAAFPRWSREPLHELHEIAVARDRIYAARFARGETLATDDSALARLHERARKVALAA